MWFLVIAAALAAVGVYSSRSAPKSAAVPPPPPGFVVDKPQKSLDAIYAGCPNGYTDDGKGGCTPAPGYQVDPAFIAQQQANDQAEFNANERALQDRQQAEEASYQQQRSAEELTQAVKPRY